MGLKTRGVILGVDGTLLDTKITQALVWKKVLDEVGVKTSLEEIETSLGMDVCQLIPKLAGVEIQSQRGRGLVTRRREVLRGDYLSKIKRFPQAREFLLKIRSEGLKVAILSSIPGPELKETLESLGVGDLLHVGKFLNYDRATFEVSNLLEEALQSLGVNRAEAVLFCSTPHEIEAAHYFGIKSIAVKSGGWNEENLSQAVAIYKDISEFLSKFDDSPLSKNCQEAPTRLIA